MGAYADLTLYFKELATNNLAIGHTDSEPRFFRREIDEFMNNINLTSDGPCLLLQSFDYKTDNTNQDNAVKRISMSFIVCKHVSAIDDYDAKDEAYDSCSDIADELIKKIWYDTLEQSNDAFDSISIESWNIQPIENMIDFWYGQYASITFINHHDMIPSTDKWKPGYITLNPDYVGND